jgi:hypothetical protein
MTTGIGNRGTNDSGFGNVGDHDSGAFNEADNISGIFNFQNPHGVGAGATRAATERDSPLARTDLGSVQ